MCWYIDLESFSFLPVKEAAEAEAEVRPLLRGEEVGLAVEEVEELLIGCRWTSKWFDVGLGDWKLAMSSMSLRVFPSFFVLFELP